ncbi:eukaryotic glutathione synthase [Blyttiomyces helicus]|uniref:Eukaryotic glutathione synthase n=1 Tax=Blyttiomyces helicus TaxID=388810 RepID=A0A4P9WCB3_9FUNG|nr:eukaryotic glutathione synthase [Blyttiomyces helicus]|eukprot:RKO90291.1 eukaryotic glutathione synthase [Blyttiomyces helicus]
MDSEDMKGNSEGIDVTFALVQNNDASLENMSLDWIPDPINSALLLAKVVMDLTVGDPAEDAELRDLKVATVASFVGRQAKVGSAAESVDNDAEVQAFGGVVLLRAADGGEEASDPVGGDMDVEGFIHVTKMFSLATLCRKLVMNQSSRPIGSYRAHRVARASSEQTLGSRSSPFQDERPLFRPRTQNVYELASDRGPARTLLDCGASRVRHPRRDTRKPSFAAGGFDKRADREPLLPNATPALPESQLKSRRRSKLAPTEIGSAPAGGVVPAEIEPATAPGAEEDFAKFVAVRELDGAGVEDTVAATEYAVGALSADIKEKSDKRAGWWAGPPCARPQYPVTIKQPVGDCSMSDLQNLEDVAPKIYFVWTKQADTFTERNHKVLEAYLYHHPDAKITVFAIHLPLDFFAPLSAVGYNIQVMRSDDAYLASMSNWSGERYGSTNSPSTKRAPSDPPLRAAPLGRNIFPLRRGDPPATCDWCIVDTDERYATGVMGSPAGHLLIRGALRIGFESEYDASKKDSAIRIMSVAFRLRSDIHVLPTDYFYPYGPTSITWALQAADDPEARVDWLRTVSLSLHLYDYKTKDIKMEKGSILEAIFCRFSVLRDPALEGDENRGIAADGFVQKGPRFIGISQGVVELRMCALSHRVPSQHNCEISPSRSPSRPITAKYSRKTTTSKVPKGRDSLTLVLHTGATTDPAAWRTTPIYDMGALVTLVVKTWKHNAYRLLNSAMYHYPTMGIIVSDDGGGTSHEGEKRGHYYLSLRYNAGVSAVRYSMIKLVKTEYFLTLDDEVFIDNTSNIAALVHALETPRVSDGALFDIAAGKSLAQQFCSGFFFCGLFTVDTDSRVLSLGPGYVYPESHETCRHIEFVANAFVARTKLIRNKLQLDERLNLGELEAFFLPTRDLYAKTVSQTLRSPALLPNTRTLTFVAYGRRRHLSFPEEARWRTELLIWIAGGGGIGSMANWQLWADLDINVPDWQHRTLTVCLAPGATVVTIEVVGAFEASSGVVLWDDWILVRDLEVDESWAGPVGAGGDDTGWLLTVTESERPQLWPWARSGRASTTELVELRDHAVDRALASGLVVRTIGQPAHSPAHAQPSATHAPFALFTSPFPRSSYEDATKLPPLFNLLVDKIANDHAFLKDIMERCGSRMGRNGAISSIEEVDDFVAKHIYKVVLAKGVAQPSTMGLLTSDYLLRAPTNASAEAKTVIQQVELNTIASSFKSGGRSSPGPILLQVFTSVPRDHRVGSSAKLKSIAKGPAKGWELYGSKRYGAVSPGELLSLSLSKKNLPLN